jgi:MATE family multidrug resistance protein
MAGNLTPAVLAAHQIVLNWASVTFMVPLGLSAATAVSVGHAVGAKRFADARRLGWLGIACAVAFMSLAAAAFILFPIPILHVYTHDPGVIASGVPLLLLAAAFQVFDGVQAVATGSLRGLGETRMPMLANLGGYWFFGLPLGYWLCFRLGWGVQGLWTGLTTALIAISVVVLAKWQRDSLELA